ncbi:hypothetical protein HAZT_HAZT006527 [Hyalella azteca]|uniref:Myosin motor domain-containing protein n=1 Tax=Hyalella azteca TaxID=294128 RepID=A0A6A0H4B9_HYAAZ|nr:hypothetical protein HAZT_HAZT006527 [Hyalella azteca]
MFGFEDPKVLETVNLMAGGYPHRMRFRSFVFRYRLLAPSKKLRRTDEKTIEDCKTILEFFLRNIDDVNKAEGARQQLEMQRIDTRHRSATLIQAHWRGWHTRRRWPTLRRSLELRTRSQNVVRPRPQPITCTPPPEGLERCDHKTIQQTCDLFGLDLVSCH